MRQRERERDYYSQEEDGKERKRGKVGKRWAGVGKE